MERILIICFLALLPVASSAKEERGDDFSLEAKEWTIEVTLKRNVPESEFSEQGKLFNFVLDESKHGNLEGVRMTVDPEMGGRWCIVVRRDDHFPSQNFSRIFSALDSMDPRDPNIDFDINTPSNCW